MDGREMQHKTIFLHAGGPKAGSSALQVFLSLNAERLQELGFVYSKFGLTVKEEFTVTAGNGVNLYAALSDHHTSDVVWRSDIRKALLSYFTEGKCCAICSSENLSLLSEECWTALRQIAAEEHVAVVVCYYVRNLADFLSSSYDQSLRHGYCFTWAKFLEETKVWEHYKALQLLERTFDREALRVISYDQCRKRIAESFLEVLGISGHFDANIVDRGNQRIVNRSMTSAEREIIIAINNSAPGRMSSVVSDALIIGNRYARPEPNHIEDAELLQLEEIFGPQIQWINDSFFAGERIVKIVEPNANVESGSERSGGDKMTAYKLAFETLLREVAGSRTTAVKEITNRLLEIDWESAGDPAIPLDFDPFGYLLLNRDLVIGAVKPFRHYIDYGAREGRNWKLASGGR